jgi:hypothetical protein
MSNFRIFPRRESKPSKKKCLVKNSLLLKKNAGFYYEVQCNSWPGQRKALALFSCQNKLCSMWPKHNISTMLLVKKTIYKRKYTCIQISIGRRLPRFKTRQTGHFMRPSDFLLLKPPYSEDQLFYYCLRFVSLEATSVR